MAAITSRKTSSNGIFTQRLRNNDRKRMTSPFRIELLRGRMRFGLEVARYCLNQRRAITFTL